MAGSARSIVPDPRQYVSNGLQHHADHPPSSRTDRSRIVALAEGEAAGEAGAPKNDETQAVTVETLAVQPQLQG